jgi:hypothetical protein
MKKENEIHGINEGIEKVKAGVEEVRAGVVSALQASETVMENQSDAEDRQVHRQEESEDAADRRHDGLKNHATKLTFLCVAGTIAVVISTLLYTWHFGRPLEAAMGIVPAHTKSAKQMVGDIDRLTLELDRLTNENERKDRRLKNYRETMEIYNGFMFGDTNRLNKATKLNPYRTNGFPVTDWHPVLAEALVKASVSLERTKALKWLTTQSGWYSIFSKQTVLDVRNAVSSELRVENGIAGATALHSVTTTRLAELLIAEGADVNATTRIGRTPLHYAATLGIAELLIANGAEVNAVMTGGRFAGSTPLDTSDNADIAALLRKHGAKTGRELQSAEK